MNKKMFKKVSMMLMLLASVSFAQKIKAVKFATVGKDTIKIWDDASLDQPLQILEHQGVGRVEFHPTNPNLLISHSHSSKTIKVWILGTDQEVGTLKYIGKVDKITPHPTNLNLFITTSINEKTIKVWNLHTGQARILDHEFVHQVLFHPKNPSLLVSRSYQEGWDEREGDGTVKIWNLKTYKEIRTLEYDEMVREVKFHPINPDLLVLKLYNKIKIWNIKINQEVRTFYHKKLYEIKFHLTNPDLLVSWSEYNDKIKIWNIKTGQKTTLFHEEAYLPCFHPTSSDLLISCNRNTIKVWDLRTGQPKRTLEHKYVNDVLFHPRNPDLLVSRSMEEETIKIWDLRTGQEEGTLVHRGFGQVLFYPTNPDLLISTSHGEGTIKVWDLKRIQEKTISQKCATLFLPYINVKPLRWNIPILEIQSFSRVFFHPTNPDLNTERKVKFWDLRTGQLERTFAHKRVSQIAFQPIETQEEEIHREQEQKRLGFLLSLRKEQREREEATGETAMQIEDKKLFIPSWGVGK